eukprot:COSAG02_NODE_34271_length_486_cov_1.338501_1_plen_119_part_10
MPLISARVLALAQKYMDTPIIRRSLNGSEAIARGCALYAAMALPTFNDARRIQLTDTTPYDSKCLKEMRQLEHVLCAAFLLAHETVDTCCHMAVSVVLTAPPAPAAALKGEASKLLSPE